MKVKLSELRKIVKSIIRETTEPTPAGPSTPNLAAELAKMKNVPVRWYKDEANTSPYLIMTIKNIVPSGNNIKIEGLWENESNVSNSIIFLECKNNFGMFKDVNNGNMKLYNTKYIEKLKALLCTKSAGGVEVTNIGDYSSTTSKAPVNVAESKRKLTNVIRQVVKEQMTGYAGGTYTPGKGGDAAFKSAGKGGASTLPDDILKKITPCVMKAGFDSLTEYPITSGIILKMVTTQQLPNPMTEVPAALDEVSKKGLNLLKLMEFFNCVLQKI